MVKIVFCLRRREDVSEEEFHRYWRDEHGPLVRSHAEALGIRRYVQSHPCAGSTAASLARLRGATEHFDGIAELWFDSVDAIGAASLDEAGRGAARALLIDEGRFIDLARSPIWIYDEESFV